MGWGVIGPGPAAEAGGAIVGESLVDLLLGVHNKRAVLGDRLADRYPLQKQEFAGARAVAQFGIDAGVERQSALGGYRLAACLNSSLCFTKYSLAVSRNDWAR